MNTLRFGKLPAKRDYQIPRFEHYRLSNLLTPPPRFCALDRWQSRSTAGNAEAFFPIHGDDPLQHCTVVAMAHALSLATAGNAHPSVMTARQVISTGRRQSGAADQALALTDVLNSGKLNPELPGGGIRAFLAVDWRDHSEVRLAMHMFGGLCIGFQLTADCVEAFELGRPWTPGLPIDAGQAACAIGYDQTGVHLLTWGRIQRGTWQWWDECVDEAYGIFPACIADGVLPGLDVRQLIEDLGERQGAIPDTQGGSAIQE